MTESARQSVDAVASLEHEASRLRGTLVAKLALQAEQQSPSAYVDSLRRLEGVRAHLSLQSEVWSLDSGAQLVTALHLEGVRHLSVAEIQAFSHDKARSSSGKFGPGTYFGAGALKGETVDLLAARANYAYDASITGAFLLLDRSQVKDTARNLRDGLGLPHPQVVTSIQNAPLTEYLEGYAVGGQGIAGAIIFSDKDRTAAEVVVSPSATHLIQATPSSLT
jgi:hypothetical protein